MIPESMKKTIDGMTYEQLLGHWRFAAIGDPFFKGEVGDYYAAVMRKKKEEVGNDIHVAASKRLGWDR